METNIKIEKMNSGKIRAKADVEIILGEGSSITIKGFRVIHDDVRPPWAAVPQSSYVAKGQTRYLDLVLFSPDVKAKVLADIVREYQKL